MSKPAGFDVASLAKPYVRELVPYSPGKPIAELERELGLSGSAKLASNEAPLGPSRRAIEAIFGAAEELNRYPEDSCHELREALAERLGVPPEGLVFGTGSDGILELVAKAFLGPGDEVVFAWPSFAMYPIVTKGAGAQPVPVPLDASYRADPEALLAAITPQTRVLFLANPNNPTSTSLGRQGFERLLAGLPERVLFVADEAYLEYVRRGDFPDAVAAIEARPTLLVLRTFSKIYGLAGLRVGFGIGHPDLIGLLERARHPFNVNQLAQVAARAALEDEEHVERVRELTHQGLQQLERGLDELGLGYAESDANFVLIEVGPGARELYERLLRQGLITRPLDGFGMTEHLRVTVGLPDENRRLLEALGAELAR